MIFDLSSTNGLFVNGVKVTSKELEDGDRILAGTALLVYIADEAAVAMDKLLAQLENGDPKERELAADLLGQLGTPFVVEALLTALREDSEPKVKAAATDALGLLGDSRAAGTLLGYFDTGDTVLRHSVARALVRLADDKVIDGVARYLAHEDRKVRILAAHVLGQTHNKHATKYLEEALADDAFAVREAAIKALGDIGDPMTIASLINAANNPDRFPRMWVIESLGKLRTVHTLPILVAALRDASPEVREAAADALGKLRVKEVVPELIVSLTDSDARVKKAASLSLERFRKYIERGRKLRDMSGKDSETVEIGLIGEPEDTEPVTSGAFGQDPSKWQQWWTVQQSR